MGRQFEYNRFDNDSEDIKQEVGGTISECKQKEFLHQKSLSPQTNKKSKSLKKYDTRILPPYSELYPEHDLPPLKDETTTKRTKSTLKSVEIAIKKYHQLSKFLIQSHQNNNNNDNVTTDTNTNNIIVTATPGSLEKDDCEMIGMATASVPKKPKVYDCMRDFLRKKFFHPASISEEESEEAVEFDDEVDYLTMMEDSYDIKDVDDVEDDDDDDECLLVVTSNHQTRSKCIRLVESGGCWPKNEFYLEDGDEVDSDVGIKDCCQLLSGSPKAEKNGKSPKRKPIEIPSELRDATWFQPNISGKAAAEKLSKESPGAFIIRQSSSVKPGNYILSLRMETKVKKFIILGSPRCYKIKGAKKEFSSLKALVTHHSVMAEQLPVTLSLPRQSADEKFSHRFLDDFDTFESLQILGILKFLQSKNLEFS